MSGLFGKKQSNNSTETKLGALNIQNSSQGFPVPIVFGKTRISSNLLWYGDFTAIPATTTQKTGGKGGGSSTSTSTSYTYTTGVIFGLMEGPSASANFIGTVWSEKVVTDALTLGLTEFQGGYSQNPWSYLTTNHANQALSYRGDVYAATGALALGDSDGLPNMTFEVIGLLGATDQNPADIITQLACSDKFGVGFANASLGNLTDFANYCTQAGFLCSPAYTSQTPMSQMLSDLLLMSNSNCVWSGDGLLKIIPYADMTVGTYVPNLTIQYYLGYDDFIAADGTDPVQVSRTRQADAYNSVSVECLDRTNQYNPLVVTAQDQLAINTYGLRPMSQLTLHMICDGNVARTVAQAILQRVLYVRNTYTFTVGWRYGRLEPMDIVALTDVNQNLVQQPVRIITIAEDENGQLQITAEEMNIGVSSPGTYAAQTSNGATPQNNAPPGNAVAPFMLQPPLALTGGNPQVWLGTAGGANWGGAQVWASTDNSSFSQVGTITGPARFGTLTANFAIGVDPDVVNTLAVDLSTSNGVLIAASNAVANAGGSMAYIAGSNSINGEVIDYTTANMTSAFHFSMANMIRRGQEGSTAAAHNSGVGFMRLDDAVGAFDVATSLFGSTIYIKLLSYNTTGNALQGLSDVNAYTLALQTQVVTSGNGYPYYADRTSTANTPSSGFVRFNNAAQANATKVYFHDVDAQGANIASVFTSFGNAGVMTLRDAVDTAKWATYAVTAASANASVQTFTVVFSAGGNEFPNGDTLTVAFSPTGVTGVGLSMPAGFSVANSPVASVGTLAVTWNSVSANTIFAGPSSGNAAAPAARAMVPADMPVFKASGANHAAGAVPDPGSTANNVNFLREDGSWAIPAGGNGGGGGGSVATDGLFWMST